MRQCEKLIQGKMSNSKGRSKDLRKLIREQEKIENPNPLQQYCLCSNYKQLFHIPFLNEPNIVENFCKDCSLKQTDSEVFNILHSSKYGELIWGKVYL